MDKAVYTRPDKPLNMVVQKRDRAALKPLDKPAEPLTVHCSTNCHVTPPDIAANMANYLEAYPDMLTLEPSAGTGNLVQALLDTGHSKYEITIIERNVELYRACSKRFRYEIAGFNECFLEYAEKAAGRIEFPRIIMNPPFERNTAKRHIEAALKLLGPGGHADAVLVALVPSTFEHPDAIHLEDIEPGAFTSTQARTKIIRIERY